MPADSLEAVDRGDVGMVQRRERLRLALEPRQAFGVGGERVRQDLDRDLAAERRVRRPIHLPHAAFADLRGDFVDAETGAGSEGQCVRDYTGLALCCELCNVGRDLPVGRGTRGCWLMTLQPTAGTRHHLGKLRWRSARAKQRIVGRTGIESERHADLRTGRGTVRATIHVVVENQIALGEAVVMDALSRLRAEGLTRHDAVHAVGMVLAENIYEILKSPPGQTSDPNPPYFDRLRRLSAAEWLRSG